jgi:mannose-6-phosphate isomerase-like protein (cupin superfamily)
VGTRSPAGTHHNILNSSDSEALELYTIYSPPEPPNGTINKDKAEADAYEAEHHH